MIDYTKEVRVGQKFWYACLIFTSSRRKDKVSKSRSIRPVKVEIIEKTSSGGYWGLTVDGTRVYINSSSAKFMFHTEEEAVEYWNYVLQDAIEYTEYRYQEIVKGLKKNIIPEND